MLIALRNAKVSVCTIMMFSETSFPPNAMYVHIYTCFGMTPLTLSNASQRTPIVTINPRWPRSRELITSLLGSGCWYVKSHFHVGGYECCALFLNVNQRIFFRKSFLASSQRKRTAPNIFTFLTKFECHSCIISLFSPFCTQSAPHNSENPTPILSLYHIIMATSPRRILN